MVLCYLETMGATGCLTLGKWDHPFLLLLCLHQLEKHKEGRGSKVFLQQLFAAVENVNCLVCIHHCNVTFSYLSC